MGHKLNCIPQSSGVRATLARLVVALGVGSALYAAGSDDDVQALTVSLPGGTSAVGAFTMASVYGQPTMIARATSGSNIVTPGFLCIEREDLGVPGDLNGDGHVNGIDLAVILGSWGSCGGADCVADVNDDSMVDGVDLAIVLGAWG